MGKLQKKHMLLFLTALSVTMTMGAARVYGVSDAPGGDNAGVQMVSGGIGEEMDALKSVENQYNLKLLFTEANGMYLADLPVSIKDKHGEIVVDTVTKGPLLLLNLPQGTYKVTAVNGEETREQKVTVPNKRKYHFVFPTRDIESSSD